LQGSQSYHTVMGSETSIEKARFAEFHLYVLACFHAVILAHARCSRPAFELGIEPGRRIRSLNRHAEKLALSERVRVSHDRSWLRLTC